MPANVGAMFYTGEMPWHGGGNALERPATMDEALGAGGLDWEVHQVEMTTDEDPPSPIRRRVAWVRSDRPAGHEGRVLGVTHRDFRPMQNRHGAVLFDAIFGQGLPVYHTGGYLGNGEVVWLLAAIDQTVKIGSVDYLRPYALFANSHDGSMAFNISLTMVRVVCQNTLRLAVNKGRLGEAFRRRHSGSYREHAQAAQEFFAVTRKEIDNIAAQFSKLSTRTCSSSEFERIVGLILPDPPKPTRAGRGGAVLKAWETRVEKLRMARAKILDLRESGKGADLESAKGTLWGALNAVLEYVDHHQQVKGSRLAHSLFSDGADIKSRAFQVIRDAAA